MIQLSEWAGDWLATMDSSAAWHAKCLARRPEFFPSDKDDHKQELLLELHRQRPRFDPERSSSSTFANRVFRNRSVELVRGAKASKRAHTREPGVANFDEQFGRSEDENLRDLGIEVRQLVADLPLDLRPLAELLQVCSQKEAARQLGLSRRQMAKQIKRLREICEEASLHVYLPGIAGGDCNNG